MGCLIHGERCTCAMVPAVEPAVETYSEEKRHELPDPESKTFFSLGVGYLLDRDLDEPVMTPCPKCGSIDGFYRGYGFMGGGIGAYEGCNDCEYFEKTQDSGE